jgi:mannose-6-phosphate isomerase-like protein (cupin superfamily)
VRRTLAQFGIAGTTFYRWYDRYRTGGPEALEDRRPKPNRVWNRIPDAIRAQLLQLALDEPERSPRELAMRHVRASIVLRFGRASWTARARTMDASDRGGVIRLVEAEARIPGPAGERAALVLQRGTLDIKLSIPIRPNQQTPHEQDELYVVIRGRGVLVHDDKRNRFHSGDILFVAAGVEHHYEDFSDDLALWRIFYGRRGGEIPA